MPDAVRDIAISAEGLERSFGSRKAVRKLSLDLPAGSSLVVFGPNGAGKTTLLRMLALLDKPTKGSLRLFGIDVSEQAEQLRSRIGFVSHSPMLYLDMSAQENLEFYARLYGVHDERKRAADLLEQLQLAHRRNDLVRGFSRGMKQRMAFARAVIHEPEVLLLDEPYTGLDPHAASIIDTMLACDSFQRTSVTVSHDLLKGYEKSTHVLIMSKGARVAFVKREDVPFEELQKLYSSIVAGR